MSGPRSTHNLNNNTTNKKTNNTTTKTIKLAELNYLLTSVIMCSVATAEDANLCDNKTMKLLN